MIYNFDFINELKFTMFEIDCEIPFEIIKKLNDSMKQQGYFRFLFVIDNKKIEIRTFKDQKKCEVKVLFRYKNEFENYEKMLDFLKKFYKSID